MLDRRLVLILASTLLAACGGTTVVSTGGDGGPMDSGLPTDGGCITPTLGAACTSSETACQPADPCCTGYEWACDASGTWTQLGLGCACEPAPNFACGSTTCPTSSYCTDTPPGIAPPDAGPIPDSYSCSPIPVPCLAAPTCACVEATLPQGSSCSPQIGATCTQDSAGNVTLHCLGE